ncbi:DUF4912 domain-containing protein [Cerasicoccus maritimus]|uniref:DUF4912 domain-containing protein n=1 Tax=Cerasicoccus maritimus TaxID=490089 RepID=UPI0028526C59|nr:DUF4912 domain-containing protein [Cerasicoccus maritimus]
MAFDALSSLSDVIDSQEIKFSAPHQPNLMILPVSPGRIHAHWALNPELLEEGRQVLGVGDEEVNLILRTYNFGSESTNFAEANSTKDFPVEGLNNSGYFDLQSTPQNVGAVVGLKNAQGHFRPLVRAGSVALPQPSVKPAPAPSPEPQPTPPVSRQANPEVALNALNESAIIARLPRLSNLPEELLKSPNELAFFKRVDGESLPEADIVQLQRKVVLDESEIHDAIISGNCKELKLPADAATDKPAASDQPPANAELPDSAGASELFASQWADSWDTHSPINLRAELTINGKLGVGMKLALGGKLITPLPGGQFKVVRKLSGFAEVLPLFITAGMSPVNGSNALELAKDAATGQPLLEIHASVSIEGRINDESYLKLLPPDVPVDDQGCFSLHRAMPNGALLLPGLSLIAEA